MHASVPLVVSKGNLGRWCFPIRRPAEAIEVNREAVLERDGPNQFSGAGTG